MGAAQPLNADITIFRTVRAERDNRMSRDSIGTIIKRLRPLVMSVPGQELVSTYVTARDTTARDYSVYGRDGFPIVIALQRPLPFSVAQESLPGVDFAYQIGQDWFIHNAPPNVTNDLHQDLRNVNQGWQGAGAALGRIPQTTVAAGSNGAVLPQAVINVVSTANFPPSGTMFVNIGGQPIMVDYTGVTATSFTGCTLADEGAGMALATGNAVAASAETLRVGNIGEVG